MKNTVEQESFAQHKARKEKGQRGKASEDTVQGVLTGFKAKHLTFDFDRIYDTRSAGRPLPPRVSDFTVFVLGRAYALEVKEVKTGSRLKKFVQLPRLHRRFQAGVYGYVLAHFLESGTWVLAHRGWFYENNPTAASWDLLGVGLNQYHSAKAALKDLWQL